ncbi:MAG: SDR family NAD(P)-dependent oxidoreductase [Deltaproteobacteria bacterium]|nr:SDR family NAD(P)-dependent oxidoreductase [Deltaproteobacteria bacterium]
MDLKQVVALVTGGASGCGEGTVRYFLGKGAKGAVILDLNEERANRIVAELGADKVLFVKTDVSDTEAVEAAVKAGVAKFGGINVIVNAAAIGAPGKILGRDGPMDMKKFVRAIQINLFGPVNVIRAGIAEMVKNAPNADGERGVIVNVSSGAAYEGQIGQAAYSAAKAGLVGLNMPLAREFAAHGVRVMSVSLGMFDTPLYEQVPPAVKDDLIRQSLFPKRMGRTDEFAMCVEEIVRNPLHNARDYRFDAGLILSPHSK